MADTPQDVPVAPVADAPAESAAPAAPADDPIMDILTDGTDNPTKAPSSSAKEEKSQVADGSAEDAKGDDTPASEDDSAESDDGEEPEAPEEASPQPPTGEAQPQGKAEARKEQLNTEIRDLVSQRNALKTDIEKINGEYYQPATEEQLVESGLSPTDAKLEALNQRLEVKDYNDRVAEAQLTIESQAQRVLNDFPIFDEGKPEYNKALADQAAELFNDSLVRDENTGQVVGSSLSTYKLYQALAASHSVSAQNGKIEGQRATEKMLARTDTSPGAAPKGSKKDPIMAILEDVYGD